MSPLRRIKQAVREQRYRVSSHGNDEMADDLLMAADIENIIYTGQITQKLTLDSRGRRYVVCGDTLDYRRGIVVCRFLLSGVLLIITCYVLEEED